ncbi:MAG: hypothetical protein PVG03_16575 [Desulfarculaceae bacterium]
MHDQRSKPFLKAGDAKKGDPGLAYLLEPLPDDAPLGLEYLNARAAPGQPLDRLNACIIILNYMRQGKP